MTSKWAKRSGGPSGNETGNMVMAFQPSKIRTGGKIANLEVAPTLKAETKQGDTEMVMIQDVAPTLSASGAGVERVGGQGAEPGFMIPSGLSVRRLTPRECERLQGFPDDYTLIPYRKRMASDSVRYKAIGNSMAVPCMGWIGKRIAMVDALL